MKMTTISSLCLDYSTILLKIKLYDFAWNDDDKLYQTIALTFHDWDSRCTYLVRLRKKRKFIIYILMNKQTQFFSLGDFCAAQYIYMKCIDLAFFAWAWIPKCNIRAAIGYHCKKLAIWIPAKPGTNSEKYIY